MVSYPATVVPRNADGSRATVACAHCGDLVRVDAAHFRNDKPYCCQGCLTVARMVEEHGWGDFYVQRDGFSPRPDNSVRPQAEAAASALAPDVLQEDCLQSLKFRVDGIQCAACVWLVEKALSEQPGVQAAQVSYGNGIARLQWNPEQTSLTDIMATVQTLGYRPAPVHTEKQADRGLLSRLGVAAFCAGNVMTVSIALYAGWFDGMEPRYYRMFEWLALALATPAVTYSAQPFFTRAWTGLRMGILSMDVPIALAVVIMFVHGLVAIVTGGHAYMDSLTMLIALLLGGRWVEEAGRTRADRAADAVSGRLPAMARRVTDAGVEDVPASSLAVGDRVIVGLGSIVPADGTVVAGNAALDSSALTGEAEPVATILGSRVSAGAMVVDGQVELLVVAAGEDTLLATMARRISDGSTSASSVVRFSDRVAPLFTGLTLAVATATFGGWAWFVGPAAAIAPTVAVLVTACPCALALATPAALSVAMGAAARRGAWIRDADAVIRLAKIDRVLLDKTGTLTEGSRRVVDAADAPLQLAAAVERGSTHPVARAIATAARERGLALLPSSDVHEEAGRGITGVVDGQRIRVEAAPGGVRVFADDRAIGDIELRDVERVGATADARLPVPVEIVSGDNAAAVHAAAVGIGAQAWFAQTTPDQKVILVEERQRSGDSVMFVGDGINDAAAIAEASVGVAMSSGTPAAVLAADIVVFSPSLRPLEMLLRLGTQTERALRLNAALSITYNVTAVAAAAAGLVNPLIAAILMPVSSAVVIAGALSIEWRMSHGDHRPSDSGLVAGGAGLRRTLHLRRA